MSLIEQNEKKIIFIGDLHLNYQAPRSRIDDYPNALLEKLSKIKVFASKSGIDTVIFLGDIFHQPHQPFDYLNKVIEVFNEYKQAGIRSLTVTGNHDIQYMNVANLHRSALGLLYNAKVIEHLVTLEYTINGDKYVLVGNDYNTPIKAVNELPNRGEYNILVSHSYYNFPYGERFETIYQEDIPKYGYDYYVLGHDHAPYSIGYVGDQCVVRPGSMSRGSSKDYNIKRNYFNIDVLTLGDGIQYQRYQEKITDPKLVFSSEVMESETINKLTSKLTNNFDTLIEMMSKKRSNSSVYSILDNITAGKEAKDLIIYYLEQRGIVRRIQHGRDSVQ